MCLNPEPLASPPAVALLPPIFVCSSCRKVAYMVSRFLHRSTTTPPAPSLMQHEGCGSVPKPFVGMHHRYCVRHLNINLTERERGTSREDTDGAPRPSRMGSVRRRGGGASASSRVNNKLTFRTERLKETEPRNGAEKIFCRTNPVNVPINGTLRYSRL